MSDPKKPGEQPAPNVEKVSPPKPDESETRKMRRISWYEELVDRVLRRQSQ
jgi:hypothetical protein